MGIKKEQYLKNYWAEMHKQDMERELDDSGADYIYDLLWSNLVRKYWKDAKGFPIKQTYYDQRKLACCASIRQLVENTGYGDQKVQKLLKQLKNAEYFDVFNDMSRGQSVYVLGEWKPVKIEDEFRCVELLYRYEGKPQVITAPSTKFMKEKFGEVFVLELSSS